MAGKEDPARRPDEHYQPVEYSRSTKDSIQAVGRIKKLSGQARTAAENIERRKRRNRAAMRGN